MHTEYDRLFQTEQQFMLEYLNQQIVYVTVNNYLLFVDAPPTFSASTDRKGVVY